MKSHIFQTPLNKEIMIDLKAQKTAQIFINKAHSGLREELFQRLSLIRTTIQNHDSFLYDIKSQYVFNQIFSDDLLHLMCIMLPISDQEFFECNIIDMQGAVTRDCLGGFVERFVPLFIEEIRFLINNHYPGELKNRVLKVDQCYTVQSLDYSTVDKDPKDKPKEEPKEQRDSSILRNSTKFDYASDDNVDGDLKNMIANGGKIKNNLNVPHALKKSISKTGIIKNLIQGFKKPHPEESKQNKRPFQNQKGRYHSQSSRDPTPERLGARGGPKVHKSRNFITGGQTEVKPGKKKTTFEIE